MSTPPPSLSLNRQRVLDEDEYTAALSHIIARDFFPSLVHLESANEYLDAEKKWRSWLRPGQDITRMMESVVIKAHEDFMTVEEFLLWSKRLMQVSAFLGVRRVFLENFGGHFDGVSRHPGVHNPERWPAVRSYTNTMRQTCVGINHPWIATWDQAVFDDTACSKSFSIHFPWHKRG